MALSGIIVPHISYISQLVRLTFAGTSSDHQRLIAVYQLARTENDRKSVDLYLFASLELSTHCKTERFYHPYIITEGILRSSLKFYGTHSSRWQVLDKAVKMNYLHG